VTLAFTASAGVTLNWDADSDLRVSSAAGADTIANGSGAAATLSLYGTAAQINAYLSAGKLKASLSGSSAGSVSVTLNGAATGIVVNGAAGNSMAVSGNTVSASAVSLPTLHLPSAMTILASEGQITLEADALGAGTAIRTVVISTDANVLSATGLGSGVTATGSVSNVSTITLTGTYDFDPPVAPAHEPAAVALGPQRQILRLNNLVLGQYGRQFYHGLQLAHVAREGVAQEQVAGFL
jgi:hypothetical protein